MDLDRPHSTTVNGISYRIVSYHVQAAQVTALSVLHKGVQYACEQLPSQGQLAYKMNEWPLIVQNCPHILAVRTLQLKFQTVQRLAATIWRDQEMHISKAQCARSSMPNDGSSVLLANVLPLTQSQLESICVCARKCRRPR